MDDPTLEYLNKCFDCCPVTGVLRWKRTRPLGHLANDRHRRIWLARFAGKVAGWTGGMGYKYVGLDGRCVKAHRIVWIMTRGPIPEGKNIDHINGDRGDNRPNNMRPATQSENMCNAGSRSDNTSGHVGVGIHKASGKWRARIVRHGSEICLGYFDTVADAIAARVNAEVMYHGEFAATVSREQQSLRFAK